MWDLNKIPISRVEIVVAMIMNEAIARGHKENGGGYTPSCRLMSLLMDINEEVTRGINERMNVSDQCNDCLLTTVVFEKSDGVLGEFKPNYEKGQNWNKYPGKF